MHALTSHATVKIKQLIRLKLGLRPWLDDGANVHFSVFHVPAENAPHINDAAGPPMVEEALPVIGEVQVGRREVAAIVPQGNLGWLWLGDGAIDHVLGGHVPAHGGPHVSVAAGPVVEAIEEVLVGLREVAAIVLQAILGELWLDDGAIDHAFIEHVTAQDGPHVIDAAGPERGPSKRCR